MLVVFSPTFVTDTKIVSCNNFVAPLNDKVNESVYMTNRTYRFC